FSAGQMAYPFIADGMGQRLMTPYWPGGPFYPVGINQAGWVAGFGGPLAQQPDNTQDWWRPVIYTPDGTPIAPPMPVPIWAGSPIAVRFLTAGLDNVIGSAGIPTMVGTSAYLQHGGALDVWHLNGDVVDGAGPHSLTGLPATPGWTTDHTGGALGA